MPGRSRALQPALSRNEGDVTYDPVDDRRLGCVPLITINLTRLPPNERYWYPRPCPKVLRARRISAPSPRFETTQLSRHELFTPIGIQPKLRGASSQAGSAN